MATLTPYIGVGTMSGSKESIWAQMVIFIQVGSGTMTGLTEFGISFAGTIKTIFFKGTFDLSLDLLDRNPSSTSGPCRLAFNNVVASQASYRIDGHALVVDAELAGGKRQTIRMEPGGGGNRETYLGLSGAYNYAIHLAPV